MPPDGGLPVTSLKAAAAALASSLGEFKFVRVDRLEQALFLFYLKFDSLATWSCQCQKGPKCSSQSGPGAAAASRSRREKGLRPWADHHHRMIGMARVPTRCRRRRLSCTAARPRRPAAVRPAATGFGGVLSCGPNSWSGAGRFTGVRIGPPLRACATPGEPRPPLVGASNGGRVPAQARRRAGCNGPASASVLIPIGARAVTRPLVQGGHDV